jgi:hypothetical protein
MDNMDRNERDLNDATRKASSTSSTGSVLKHDDNPSLGDEVGEAAGGISGVLAGAAIGSAGGPIGTIIGGIAGAVSGWWAGRSISEAAQKFTHDDDTHYRNHYESSSSKLADRSYEDVRPAYQLGHLASQNPDYANRDFDAVETDLQRGWSNDVSTKHGDWSSVKGYARDAYQRGRMSSSGTGASMGATAAGTAGYAAGRTADKMDNAGDRMQAGASNVGHDAARTADRVGDKASDVGHDMKQGAENLWDKTKNAAGNAADKLGNAVDDTKDRVDGNPASRPGLDSTDTTRRF